MSSGWSRRSFLGTTAVGGLGITLNRPRSAAAETGKGAPPIETKPLEQVRVGFVGVGLQGSSHVENLLKIDGVEIRALCDISEWKVARAQEWIEAARRPKPAAYTRGERDFERLCERDDLDLVITATPWRWHVPICVAAMKAGKHAATEVPAAVTIDECWQLVEVSEQTRRHCVMLENCCYSERALLTLNLVRRGLLGEIIHGMGGYLHDLREIKLSGRDEAVWRREHSINRNGDLYPTHGLGPIAEAMDINRGDRFDYMVSMSTMSRGLKLYAAEKWGPEDSTAVDYALGDVTTSMLHTVKGRTITLVHDTSSPRPYSRIDRVQGTKGIIEGYPDRVHVEGRSRAHRWESFDAYLPEHGHALWKQLREQARGAGHGGMDYLEDYRLIDALLKGRYPDMDVYDAAAWSAVSELSERSIGDGSAPVPFPDFTRGGWERNEPVFVTDIA
jgi:predicted dehydrogenase